jgi:glycosyltransferase involved in cell wall biosynthesis
VTVAVRSQTPANRLEPCLDSLLRLDYLPLDRVLVDASDDQRHVEALVRERYPQIRYKRAPGPGMASRQAIEECRGDILAVTDGESVVDRQWVSTLVHVFLADPEVMTVSGLVVPDLFRQPFRPALLAGAPFCRSWWHVRGDVESGDGAMQREPERASSNSAYWRPPLPTSSRYTRVWEPAAIVRTLAALPMSAPANNRGPVRTLDRHVDLRDGVVPISDACDYDSLRLHVTWSGEPVGIVRLVHDGAVVSRLWIHDAIAQQLTAPILDAGLHLGPDVSRALLTADLVRHMFTRWKPGVHRTSTQATVRTAAA